MLSRSEYVTNACHCGRIFFVLRQFCVSDFLHDQCPDSTSDLNAQCTSQLIVHMLVPTIKKACGVREHFINRTPSDLANWSRQVLN